MENGMCLKNDIVCHKKASNKCNECNQFLAMQALTAISNNMPLNSLFFVLFVIDLSNGKIFTTMEWLMVFVKVPL